MVKVHVTNVYDDNHQLLASMEGVKEPSEKAIEGFLKENNGSYAQVGSYYSTDGRSFNL
ncbi:hypothetical protein [Sutcliffiella sp. FSL R7-0096]|uniref:hypothetical protein n=1 Tax=Sutcliffiella sp. FSL R7-0096 TaxID=2921670 RepID=UPI003159F5BA